MKMDITFSLFTDMFHRHNRNDNFSFGNMKALYDYLEEVYDGEYVLDVIELCSNYSELTVDDIINDCSLDDDEAKELSELEDAIDVHEWLNDHGFIVVNVDGDLKVLIED